MATIAFLNPIFSNAIFHAKIPSFIATLGMLFMARSIAVVISGGFPPSVPKDLPTEWLVGRVDMLRVSIFWLIGIAIVCNFILKKTNAYFKNGGGKPLITEGRG